MVVFADADLSTDKFLGGRLEILQPKAGHRAGIDPVLLAASVDASPGESVLDLGCGSGVAALCIGARVPDMALTGAELQLDYVELAARNAQRNQIALTVFQADIAKPNADLRRRTYHHVIANPPFYDRARGSRSPDVSREIALGGHAPLRAWADTATKRARPGGTITFIVNASRVADLLGAFDGRVGGERIQPLVSRQGRAAKLVLLSVRKGSRAETRLLSPIVLHNGESHDVDADDYTPQIREILRDGAPLTFLD